MINKQKKILHSFRFFHHIFSPYVYSLIRIQKCAKLRNINKNIAICKKEEWPSIFTFFALFLFFSGTYVLNLAFQRGTQCHVLLIHNVEQQQNSLIKNMRYPSSTSPIIPTYTSKLKVKNAYRTKVAFKI